MLHRACAQQPDILSALAAGREREALVAAHLAACPSCRDQAEAISWMRRLADSPELSHPVPDPGVIWWKAQLLRRWQAERAASAPIERMRWVELVAGLASLAVFLVWQWRGLASLAQRAIPAGIAAVSTATQPSNPLVLLLIAGGAASIGAMVLAGLHKLLYRTHL
jgi:predicted anti-sigma-YlaC factor YlaD